MTNQQNHPILTVPLDYRNDYLPIDYSSQYNWNQEDKAIIQQIVDTFFNTVDKGEKIVDTSVGKIKITHDQHPVGDRRKLIQGFLVESLQLKAELPEAKSQSTELICLLQQATPNWIKDNPQATKHFEVLQSEISQLLISEESLKTLVFFSVLDLIQSANKEPIDPGFTMRLKNLIENLKTFAPTNKKEQ